MGWTRYMLPALLVPVTVFICLYLFVFHTPYGRDAFVRVVLDELEKRSGTEISVRSFSGSFPGNIALDGLAVSRNGMPWLLADKFRLDWKPAALARGRIHIDIISLEGARLLENPARKHENAFLPRLPEIKKLPQIRIGKIALHDFTGYPQSHGQTLRGEADLDIREGYIVARLSFESSRGLDHADMTVKLSPERFLLEGTADIKPEGIVAGIVSPERSLSLSIRTVHAAGKNRLGIITDLEKYGRLDTVLRIPEKNPETVDIALKFQPRAHTELQPGKTVTADMTAGLYADGGALHLRRISIPGGRFSGNITWKNRNGYPETVEITATGQPDKTCCTAPPLQTSSYKDASPENAAGIYRLSGKMKRRGRIYTLHTSIRESGRSLEFDGTIPRAGHTLSGTLALHVPSRENEGQSYIPAIFATGHAAIDIHEGAVLENMEFKIADRSSATGKLRYTFRTGQVDTAGHFAIGPELSGRFTPLVVHDFIRGSFSASGTADSIKSTFTADIPDSRIRNRPLDSFRITASLSGNPADMPYSLHGSMDAADSKNGLIQAGLSVPESITDRIRIPRIYFRGPDFTLDGSASYNRASGILETDLSYSGKNNAQPVPGTILNGQFRMKSVFSGKSGTIEKLDFNGSNIETAGFFFPDISIKAASLQNMPETLEFGIQSALLKRGRHTVAENIHVLGSLHGDISGHVRIESFSATVSGHPLETVKPVLLDLDNAISADDVRFSYADGGSILLDTSIDISRIMLKVQADSIPLPGIPALFDTDFNLDTDRKTPATGTVRIRSGNREKPPDSGDMPDSICADMIWDGRLLSLAAKGENCIPQMAVTIPLQLDTENGYTFSFPGEIRGKIAYRGHTAAIDTYLPENLRSYEGNISAGLSLSGPVLSPRITGEINLPDGNYTDPATGLSLQSIHARMDIDYTDGSGTVSISGSASGQEKPANGAGTIGFSGTAGLGKEALLDLSLDMDNTVLSFAPVNMMQISGRITVSGSVTQPQARGEIRIERMEMEMEAGSGTGAAGKPASIEVIPYHGTDRKKPVMTAPAEHAGYGYGYRIRVTADSSINVSGKDMNSMWSADILLAGTAGSPLVTGEILLERGWLVFSGRRFVLTCGSVLFDSLSVNDPLLELCAEYTAADSTTAGISVTGRSKNPHISLYSFPEMPDEDIMATILFGKAVHNPGIGAALQIADTLASMNNQGLLEGQSVTDRMRHMLHMDFINFTPDDENGNTGIEIGKYFGKDTFVSARGQSGGEGSLIRLEHALGRNVTIETTIEEKGQHGASLNWSMDF